MLIPVLLPLPLCYIRFMESPLKESRHGLGGAFPPASHKAKTKRKWFACGSPAKRCCYPGEQTSPGLGGRAAPGHPPATPPGSSAAPRPPGTPPSHPEVAPRGHGHGGSAPTRGTARSQRVPSRGAARSFRREAQERLWARCCVRMDITAVPCRGGGAQISTALLFFHASMTLSVLYSALFPPPNSFFFPGYLEPSYKY